MFGLRYHVASLAAVFVALAVGILLGVAVSGKLTDVGEGAELQNLRNENKQLRQSIEDAQAEADASAARGEGADELFADAYPALMRGRLEGKSVAVVFLGRSDGSVRAEVEGALADADAGPPARVVAFDVPVDQGELASALEGDELLASYADEEGDFSDLGRELGRQLVEGEDALWASLQSELVEEQIGSTSTPVDAVVVVTTWMPPEEGDTSGDAAVRTRATASLLEGMVGGLDGAGIPVVGVAAADDPPRCSTATASAASRASTTSTSLRAASPWRSCSRAPSPATTGSASPPPTASSLRSSRSRPRVGSAEGLAGLTILVPARNEEERIARDDRGPPAATSRAPRSSSSTARSEDRTAERAEAAGAAVIRIEPAGEGRGTLRGRASGAARAGCCSADADLRGSLLPLAGSSADLAVAAFARRAGRRLRDRQARGPRARPRCQRGSPPREPLSGQRLLSARARAACFPLAAGLRLRGAHDDRRAPRRALAGGDRGRPRAPGDRPRRGRIHPPRPPAPRRLSSPSARSGSTTAGCGCRSSAGRTADQGDPGVTLGRCSSASSTTRYAGQERGLARAPARAQDDGDPQGRRHPARRALADAQLSAARFSSPSPRTLLNQLDTRPGRCLKAYLLAAAPLGAPLGRAVLLLPYDLAGDGDARGLRDRMRLEPC